MDALRELATTWKDLAAELRAYGAAPQALTLDRCAEELNRTVRRHRAEVLTLAEAAEESGYSKRTLRHKVATGEIPNAGRKNAPRIRRADLPRRKPSTTPNPAGGVLDIEAEARRLAARRSG